MEVAAALEFTEELSPWAEVEWQAQCWQAAREAQSLAVLGLVRERPLFLTSGPIFCPLSTGPTESAQG